ncbi:MAG: hypothetical protein IKP40_11620 [Clostridia bacterium]|nr:hypothetical protein [Clostridia bacterium]
MKKLTVFTRARQAVLRALSAYNHRLSKLYSPNIAAFTGVAVVLAMLVFTLFIPPRVGVADDGSLSGVLLESGLGYRQMDLTDETGSYFIRLYLHSTRQAGGFSTHRLLIRAAMWVDDQFTHDNLFDIHYLAGLYILLYLPAVWLVLRGIAARVKVAAEATFLVILGAVVLGDAALTAYFSSLYPEALWHIGVVYCLGFSLALQHGKPGWTHAGLIGLTFTGGVLTLTESHCAAVGLVLTVYLVRLIMMEDRTAQSSMIAGICAAVMLTSTVVSATAGADRFTDASKLHAMTNGVLLRAENPEEALAEFGIEPRFETLTDMSSYSSYPYTLPGEPEVQRSFLSRYSIGSIIFYYIKHPLAYAGLMELGVRAAFHPVRSYVGSYERSAGLPERLANQQLTFYSNFKANSLPQTMGFLLILMVVYWALFRKRRGLNPHSARWTFRERQIMLDTFIMLLVLGVAHLSAVIFLSGTAELERYQLLCGTCVDGMILLFIAEILHRLNILSSED